MYSVSTGIAFGFAIKQYREGEMAHGKETNSRTGSPGQAGTPVRGTERRCALWRSVGTGGAAFRPGSQHDHHCGAVLRRTISAAQIPSDPGQRARYHQGRSRRDRDPAGLLLWLAQSLEHLPHARGSMAGGRVKRRILSWTTKHSATAYKCPSWATAYIR